MLVILAGKQDEIARSLAARWRDHGAHLLTSEDLSVVGWCHDLSATELSRAVVGGCTVAAEEITGILTRLPWVYEQELTHIIPTDRVYVAAEMTAFLVSWLSGLTCPVLNRPSPACLAGPNWRTEQWVRLAARLGIPVRPVRREASRSTGVVGPTPDCSSATVTVVGCRSFGEVDESLAAQAQRLAGAAGVSLLAVHFSCPEQGASFLGADLWPDVSSVNIADGILEYLSGSCSC